MATRSNKVGQIYGFDAWDGRDSSRERRYNVSRISVLACAIGGDAGKVAKAGRCKTHLNGTVKSLREAPIQKLYGQGLVLLRSFAL